MLESATGEGRPQDERRKGMSDKATVTRTKQARLSIFSETEQGYHGEPWIYSLVTSLPIVNRREPEISGQSIAGHNHNSAPIVADLGFPLGTAESAKGRAIMSMSRHQRRKANKARFIRIEAADHRAIQDMTKGHLQAHSCLSIHDERQAVRALRNESFIGSTWIKRKP